MYTRQGVHYVLKVALSQPSDIREILICDLVCVREHKPSLWHEKITGLYCDTS
jgi:hypothetical protein